MSQFLIFSVSICKIQAKQKRLRIKPAMTGRVQVIEIADRARNDGCGVEKRDCGSSPQ